METSIGFMLGLYWDNGKENGNYYNIGVIGLILLGCSFSCGARGHEGPGARGPRGSELGFGQCRCPV